MEKQSKKRKKFLCLSCVIFSMSMLAGCTTSDISKNSEGIHTEINSSQMTSIEDVTENYKENEEVFESTENLTTEIVENIDTENKESVQEPEEQPKVSEAASEKAENKKEDEKEEKPQVQQKPSQTQPEVSQTQPQPEPPQTESQPAQPEIPQTESQPELPQIPQESESAESSFSVGVYSGGHKMQAMGSELPYTYTLQFKEDGTYHYKVSFVVGGENYTEEEDGTYSINGTAITLTSSTGIVMSGSYSDGEISITRKVSSFASTDAVIILR